MATGCFTEILYRGAALEVIGEYIISSVTLCLKYACCPYNADKCPLEEENESKI